MRNKFILINKQTRESKQYKSLKQISIDLDIEYFQIRSIYLESKAPKKFLHSITKHLCEKYAIFDNPELYV